MINGEYVGKQLAKPAKGTSEVDPTICPHTAEYMKARGNGRTTWWTCNACLTRWQRIPIEVTSTTDESKDDDVLAFEKHAWKTYKQVLTDYPKYAKWVVSTSEHEESMHQGFGHFAAYILKKE